MRKGAETSKSVRLVAALSLAATVLAVVTFTLADPDLWGHVRFGGDMVAARTVHVADHYSFAADRPWINHEWLAEIAMYGAYRAGGSAGLVALKATLVLSVLLAVVVALRDLDLTPFMRHAFVGLALVATIPQSVHVRPQLFSFVLFAWLLVVLLRARVKPAVALAAIPMLVLWANLHGGWIVGAATLAMWAVLEQRAYLIAIAVVAILATVCNPYGVGLWAFLLETVGLSRPEITDWQPIMRLGWMFTALWLLTAAVLVAAIATAVVRRSTDLALLAIPAALAVGAFRVNRLESFFAIAVAMLASRCLAPAWTIADAPVSQGTESWPRTIAAIAILTVTCVGGAGAAASNASCVQVDAVSYPDPEVAGVVASARLHGRMLTWFDWGEYAIWHWGDRGISVSMDGRRETTYSDAVLREHLRFYFNPSARSEVLARLQPDYVWMPSDSDVVRWLTDRGWRPLFAGDRSVLLGRPDLETASAPPPIAPRAPRCFPGP